MSWYWDSAKEGDRSLTDSGKKYKPVGVNFIFIAPLSNVGDADLEFPLVSPANFLPKIKKILIMMIKYTKGILLDLLELERGDKASYRIVGCRPSDFIVLIQFFNSST